MQHGTSRSWLLSLTFGAALLAACSSSEPAPTSIVTRPIDKPAAKRSTAALDPSRFVVLESKDFTATITGQTTGLVHYVFKDPRYERAGKPNDAVSTDKLAYLPLSLDFDGIDVPEGAAWQVEQL